MMPGRLAAAILSLIAAPLVAQTDEATSVESEIICTGGGRLWNGRPDEAAAVRQKPVPESFSSVTVDVCTPPLESGLLIDWHTRYGDETTVKAALEYIEKRDGKPVAIARALERDIDRLLDEAGREFAAAGSPAMGEARDRWLGSSPSVSSLRNIIDKAHFEVLLSVSEYLQPAEVFSSSTLLARAREVFESHGRLRSSFTKKVLKGITALEILTYVESQSSSSATPMIFDLRLAALDARLNNDPQILAGRVSHYETPALRDIVKLAYGGGEDFCDLNEADMRNEWEMIVLRACRDDDYFKSQALAFGYAQSQLRIMTGDQMHNSQGWTWEDFERFYERDGKDAGDWNTRLRGIDDRIVSLHLARADRYLHESRDESLRAFPARDRLGRAQQLLWQGQEAVGRLTPRVHPARDPVRFKQLAERAFAIDKRLIELAQGDESRPVAARDTQLIAYFRINLAALDAIVTGRY